jgi:hypothetical protein
VWLARDRSRYELPSGFSLDAFLGDVLTHPWFVAWGLDPVVVRATLAADAPAGYADAIRALYRLYASTHGKTRYADKTPVFVLHLPLLAELFPEAVFVHVVRDGRNVAISRTQAAWGTDRLDQEALLWSEQAAKGRADGARLGPRRYCELRYEDLLDDPEAAARRLCAFTGLDFDPSMLRYHERSSTIVEHMPIPGEHRNLLRPPTKGLRDWRTELTPRQVALFEELAGDTLRAFGYPCVTADVPAAVRVHALGARVRHHAVARYRRARRALWHAVHGTSGSRSPA